MSRLSRKALGVGRPRAAAHLQDGNLPLQLATFLLQEGPGTWGSAAPAAVLQAQVTAEPATQTQPPALPGVPSRPSFLSPPLPLLPKCNPSTALQPRRPLPGQDVSSPCPPPSAHAGGPHSLFFTTVLGLQVLLPPFSPRSQPFPCLKDSSVVHLSPTPQDKSPQAKAPAGIPTWLLPGSNLTSTLPLPPLSPTLLGLPIRYAASLLLPHSPSTLGSIPRPTLLVSTPTAHTQGPHRRYPATWSTWDTFSWSLMTLRSL